MHAHHRTSGPLKQRFMHKILFRISHEVISLCHLSTERLFTAKIWQPFQDLNSQCEGFCLLEIQSSIGLDPENRSLLS